VSKPVSDLAGGWFGPTGTTSAGATSIGSGTGGMVADAGGNALDFNVNGAGTGVTGTFFTVSDTPRVYTVTRSDAATGLLLMSPDHRHLLYVDSAGTFGAWQKDATALAGPYDLGMIANSTWTATLAEVSPTLDPANVQSVVAQIDGVGFFTCSPFQTDTAALAVLDPVNGQYGGDFTDGVATARPVLVLATPDLEFLAVQLSRGAAFPEESTFAAWSR